MLKIRYKWYTGQLTSSRRERARERRRGEEKDGSWGADLHDSCQLLSTYYSVTIAESQGRRRVGRGEVREIYILSMYGQINS